jgi:hypothetical protein
LGPTVLQEIENMLFEFTDSANPSFCQTVSQILYQLYLEKADPDLAVSTAIAIRTMLRNPYYSVNGVPVV